MSLVSGRLEEELRIYPVKLDCPNKIETIIKFSFLDFSIKTEQSFLDGLITTSLSGRYEPGDLRKTWISDGNFKCQFGWATVSRCVDKHYS